MPNTSKSKKKNWEDLTPEEKKTGIVAAIVFGVIILAFIIGGVLITQANNKNNTAVVDQAQIIDTSEIKLGITNGLTDGWVRTGNFSGDTALEGEITGIPEAFDVKNLQLLLEFRYADEANTASIFNSSPTFTYDYDNYSPSTGTLGFTVTFAVSDLPYDELVVELGVTTDSTSLIYDTTNFNMQVTPSRTVFIDGFRLVGDDIEPGTYRTYNTGTIRNCYWERNASKSGGLSSIIANDSISEGRGPIEVVIAATDAAFKSEGCGRWEKQ